MPRIKLILSDIDGTIMPFGSQAIPRRVLDAFHAAMDAGISIGPATGRSYAQLPRYFDGDVDCCGTAIATNGLEMYLDGELVRRAELSREALESALSLVAGVSRAGLVVFDGTKPLLVAGDRDDLRVPAPDYGRICEPAREMPDKPIVKANVFVNADMAETEALAARLNREVDGLDFDIPSAGFMNVMPTGWNKGSAVRELGSHMGIGMDEVVVFGDGGNDLTMFDAVENSVAVEGAMDVATRAARWHIGRVEDCAVADAVLALARDEWPFDR